jgi:hypothetical protein
MVGRTPTGWHPLQDPKQPVGDVCAVLSDPESGRKPTNVLAQIRYRQRVGKGLRSGKGCQILSKYLPADPELCARAPDELEGVASSGM